jgi:tryptophan synthase alpha chain
MSAERIERRLGEIRARGQTALVVYLTVGDPSVADTTACALAALEAGADVLELGVPFSDPTADGPVIAAAAYRAIHSGGSLRSALEVARAVREQSDAPLVLFSYVNPLLAWGEDRIALDASASGVDGILIVDLPPEEGAVLRSAAAAQGIAIIPLVAPTTSLEREPAVLHGARGFVYYVSLTGVTGSQAAPLEVAGRAAASLRARSGLPVVVGFGIDTPEKARVVAAAGVDGVVVGTAVVRAIHAAADRESRVRAVRELVGALRSGLDAAPPSPIADAGR